MQSGGSSGLVAVLLVTSSERGTNLAFAWPRRPKILKRYSTVRYYASQASKDGDEDENKRSSYAFERSYQGSRSGPSNNQPDSDLPSAEHLRPRERDHQEEDDSDSLSSGELDALSDTASESSTSAASDDGQVNVDSNRRRLRHPGSRDTSHDEHLDNDDFYKRRGYARSGRVEGKGKGADRGRRLGEHEAESGRDRQGRSPSARPRGAVVSSSDAGDGQSESAAGTNHRRPGRGEKNSAARSRAFTSYLGYPTDVLAAFLAPRRELCQQKFELVIDDLAFLGHPICADESGSWTALEDSDDGASYRTNNRSTTSLDREGARGRSKTSRPLSDGEDQGPRGRSTGGASSRSARSRNSQDYSTSRPPLRHRTTTTPTSLNLFNLVLVLSRPSTPPVSVFSSAPSSSMALATLPLSAWLQFWHDNVIFKMAAGLFAEQCRCGYVESEADKLAAIKERCVEDGASFSAYASFALGSSTLARSLRDLYTSISRSAGAFVSINDRIDAHLQLPPIVADPSCVLNVQDLGTELDWDDPLLIAGEGRERDSASVDGDDSPEQTKTPAEAAMVEFMRTTGPFLLPWKTLLLLRERPMASLDRPPRRRPRKRATVRMSDPGASADDSDGESSALSGGSGSDSQGPEGIETWGQRFTKLLKPTLSGVPTFAELADLLGWDLYKDVYPMVRHLIYYREARVIDVPRLQGIYHPSPLFDFRRLPQLSAAWALRFPRLMPLVSLLSAASSSVQPFGSHFKVEPLSRRESEGYPDTQGHPSSSLGYKFGPPPRPPMSQSRREQCLSALIWLLQQEVVVQIHMRLRLVATEANKRHASEARTERLLKRRRQQAEKAARAARRQRKATARTAAGLADRLPKAPTRSKQEGGAVNRLMDEETRGRSRSRSRSSTRDGGATRDPLIRRESGLAATKPADTHRAEEVPPPDPSSGEKSQVEAVLRFERRPVLRSRSPSTLVRNPAQSGLAGEAVASNVPRSIPRSTEVASRPSTPRGRWTNAAVPASASHSPSNSFGGPAISAMLQSRQSRSRSQARMRVTGFGEDEEITVRVPDSSEVQDAPATASTDEEYKRLRLVIENGSAKGTSSAPSRAGRLDVSPAPPHGQLGLVAGLPASGVSSARVSPSGSAYASPQQPGSVQMESSLDGSDEEADDEDDHEEDNLGHQWDFAPSLIAEPSRASADENEWIAAMLVGKEPVVVQWFVQILPYLNGKHTLDEIVYREEIRRRDLRVLMNVFRDEIIAFTHP